MRIARLLTRLNLGGPARQALASDPRLVASGHQVRIFAGESEPGEGDLFDEYRARGLDVVRIPELARRISPARDFRALRRLARELDAFRPDVVHTHASKAGTLGRAALRRLPGAKGIARVHTFHGHVLEGYFPPLVSRRLIVHEKKLAARTDRIVAVSHATADDLVRLGVVEEEKLVVIQPGIEMEPLLELARPRGSSGELRRLVEASETDVLVGVVGRLAEVKRPALAVDLFELLAARYPQLHVVFIGDGSERGSVERRILNLAADGQRRVHILGARSDIAAVLADLDLVLLTSRSEGLPVALIEAAAAGLPAVALDVGGVGEVLVHERTGFLGTSVEELAMFVARLLEDPAERRSMGERARLRATHLFSAERLAERLGALYFAVEAERRTSGATR